jgi:hypothetical protein
MNDTVERGLRVLADRTRWQREQEHYTQIRTDGMRRLNKPFPTAADLHFPLVDMTIGDLKPFWMAQAFGGDRIADFLPLTQEQSAVAEAAADFFDFQLRYNTNQPYLRYVMEQMIDTMLHRGRGVLMATTDPYNDWAIQLKNIDPQFLLIGSQFDDFWDADSWIYVQRLSVNQYKRDRNFEQGDDIIKRITGRSGFQLSSVYYQRELIEGVTHTNKEDEIILWHEYERRPSGDLVLSTSAPMADDVEIRDPFIIPYEMNGKSSNPFHSFTMEILGSGGWYAPRSVSRLLAAFEAFCTKCMNEDADQMTFMNRPLFTGEKPMDNSANWDFFPGSYVPGNVQAVQMGNPAMSFMERINFQRGLAERRARVPDFGQFSPEDTGGKPITATQSRIASGLQAVGADHNGDTFRNIRLLSFYKHLWALMLHRNKCQQDAAKAGNTSPASLTYILSNELKELPAQAMAEGYLVLPAGGTANKEQRLQRATARLGLLKGDPDIDQIELKTEYVAADDARLVKKLVVGASKRAQSEAYEEDLEIVVMSQGRPVPVLPGQDHATRVIECATYLHAQEVKGIPVNPQAVQVIQQHMGMHLQYLKETQPDALKQVVAMLQQIESAPAPGKVLPMNTTNPSGMPIGRAPQGQQPQLGQGQPQAGVAQ